MKKILPILILICLLNINSLLFSEQKDTLEKADLLLDMMEYGVAINYYNKILLENPKIRDIRKKIGYAYFQLGSIDRAIKSLYEELAFFSDNGDAYDFLIYVLYKLNRMEEAQKLFSAIFFKLYGNETPLNLLWHLFLEQYNLKGEILIKEENPNSGLGDFLLGMYFKKKKEFEIAKFHFRRAQRRGYRPFLCYVHLVDIILAQRNVQDFFKIVEEIYNNYYEIYGHKQKSYEFFFMYGLLDYYVFLVVEKAYPHVPYQFQFPFAKIYLQFAVGMFQEALKKKPNSIATLFNLGCIHYNYGEFKEAIKYFEKILEIELNNQEVKFHLGCCYKKLNKFQEKPKECPERVSLLRDFIDNPEVKYKYQFHNDKLFILQNINFLALEFIRKGESYSAIKRFINALKIYPESPEINYNLGMLYFMFGNYQKAEKYALIALRRRNFYTVLPDNLKYYKIRELIENEKRTSESPSIPLSEWTFEMALKEGNYFLEAYDLLGNIYFRKKEYEKAILAFKKVIEIDSRDPIAHYNLGCAYSALNDWKKAEEEWKKAIKYEKGVKKIEKREEISRSYLRISLLVFKYPVAFRAHKSLGWLYLDRNLPDKALKEFKKAIELEPGDPEPYYELGKIYFTKNNREKAIYYFEKYLYLGGKKEKEVSKLLKLLKNNIFKFLLFL